MNAVGLKARKLSKHDQQSGHCCKAGGCWFNALGLMPRVNVHSLAQKLSAMAFTPPCMLGTDLTVATSSHSALSSGLVAAVQLAGGGCSWQVPSIRDDWHTPFACKKGTMISQFDCKPL
jgi:hypothetical protein